MGRIIQHPRLQGRDPAFRQRIANSFSAKRREMLDGARHLLACLIRLSDTPAYADVRPLLPACQSVIDDMSDLDPASPSAMRKLVRVGSVLEDISRRVDACTARQTQKRGQRGPGRHRIVSRS